METLEPLKLSDISHIKCKITHTLKFHQVLKSQKLSTSFLFAVETKEGTHEVLG